MAKGGDSRYGILDLVKLTGVPRRTIRYYVQRELLPPPLGAGRGHYYTEEHLERIRKIRELQSQGLRLDEIRRLLDGGAETPAPQVVRLEPAARIGIRPGVELIVLSKAGILRPEQLGALARAARAILGPTAGDEGGER